MLAILESYPVQYHAPVYRALQTEFGVPVSVIYGSDLGVAEYLDREFGVSLSWDSDLLSGYESRFLTRTNGSGDVDPDDVRGRGVREVLRELKPGALMVVGYGSRFDRDVLYATWRTACPILFRAEAADHAVARTGVRSWARDTALRTLYSRMSRLLYIGERSHAHYRRLGVPEEKLVFSPYCVETAPFCCDEASRAKLRGPARAGLGLAETDIALLFVGKISERKGPDLIARAVKHLPEPLRARVCLCFVGDGEMKTQVELLAATPPATRARLVGFRNQTQLSPYYHAADLMVLPSRRGETWGLVVNEGLHHGVPCVVSDVVGCAPDLIRDGITGHEFESDSVTSLCRVLSKSIGLVASNVTRDNCRQRVSTYTVSHAAQGIAAAYADVVNRSLSGEPLSIASAAGQRVSH